MSGKHLSGKVAIVTGAGRNIGRAIALGLAEDGASVVVNVRENEGEAAAVVREIEAKGSRAIVALGDVADANTADSIAQAAVAAFGRIDILVNNAALRREKPFTEMTYADWREVLGATLDGVFLCCKAAVPLLKSAGGGAIVNMGGLSAHTGAKDRAHVVTAKAGVIGLTRALAHDLAADGITVNCIAPGLIDTARATGHALPSHHLVKKTLAGRLGKVEEIAAAVRYLCGPGGRYVTGQTIHVNGGAFLG
ncbi:MAG: 3-oxoacyl-ACP reductase FabG [Hyphomicrobiaceae bacterium]|nr:MAG: 3-oxoacyl-ACP reductase FabG [Hyphomicrobiaceae bacterium]